MTDRPHTPSGARPRVTFALFAFNQEDFVREAIESAFAQDYGPLEIILSDDCSTDRTYEIMQQMAATYDGPHRVIARRNPFNLGTALHVQSAFDASSGDLFVVAAGDDISTPDRVTALTKAWDAAGRPEGAVHSGRESFRDGRTIARVPAKRTTYSGRDLEGYAEGYWLPAAAPTCAYTRGVFERFGPLLGGSIIEDAPLFLRVALIGEFIACNQPLVRHRLHDANSGTGYGIGSPARWNRFIQSKVIAFRTMQTDLARWTGPLDPELRARIERRILAVLQSAPGLLIPETQPIGRLARIRLGLRIATAPAVARTFALRADYVLGFFGFDVHNRLKTRLRPLIGRFRRTG